jgi:hypothetical protein
MVVILQPARVVGAPLFEYLLSWRSVRLHCRLLIFFLVFIDYLIDHLDSVLKIVRFFQNAHLRLLPLVMMGCTLAPMSIGELFL